MRSFVTFLSTPTADTPGTTLLLHFDSKRYLIGNVAEGTQRASIQQGARLLKVSEFFITGRTEWQGNGGLLGMILTLADIASTSAGSAAEELKRKVISKLKSGNSDEVDEDRVREETAKEAKVKNRLTLFGTKNLNWMLATARRFVFRKGMPVDAREILPDNGQLQGNWRMPDPIFRDENIKVWAIAVVPAQGSSSSPRNSTSGTVSPRKRSHDESNGIETSQNDILDSDLSSDEKTSAMAKVVVSEMFDSSWRMDALVETPIHLVQLPAALFIRNPETNKIEKYTGPMPGGPERVNKNITVLVRKPWPGALVETLPPTRPAKEAVSYIIRNHPQRGKFNPVKAKEYGLPPGHLWANLTKGQSVTNDKGDTISPEMVLSAGKEGGGLAVIEVPSVAYVEPIVSRPEWKSEELMTGVGAFVWILGPGVSASPALRQFMEQTKHIKHVVSSSDLCPNRLGMDSAAEATIRLSQVDPVRYAEPIHQNTLSQQSTDQADLSDLVQIADRGHFIQLEPSLEVVAESQPHVDASKVIAAMSPEVLQSAKRSQEDVLANKAALDRWADKLPQKGVEIVTLGTGSALPSKYRNVSATLLRVPGWGALLFDCGENTLGQLKRVFPPNEFDQVMRELRMIWISHMHADHHLGTVSVIKAWYTAVHNRKPTLNPSLTDFEFSPTHMFSTQRLAVVSDLPMLHWLYEYSHVEDYGFSRLAPLFISAARPSQNDPSKLLWFLPPNTAQAEPTDALSALEPRDKKLGRLNVAAKYLGLSDIQAVSVRHCHGARAVSISFPSGFKASYSGDCRPSTSFSVVGKGSTVCIHEATFDAELQGDALAKNHSTTAEALAVAERMGAQACVLTHFSQRYQKVPVLEYTEDSRVEEAMNAEEAEDAEEEGVDAPIETGGDPPPTEPENDVASTEIYEPFKDDTEEKAGKPKSNKQATIRLKKGSDMKVCVAFDYMRVKVDEIAQMEKFTPALLALFADDEKAKGNGGGGDAANGKSAKTGKKNGKGKRNN